MDNSMWGDKLPQQYTTAVTIFRSVHDKYKINKFILDLGQFLCLSPEVKWKWDVPFHIMQNEENIKTS